MRQASGISERGPSRPEVLITTGYTGLCIVCDERVEHWHEVLVPCDDDEPLTHAECAEGDGDE